MFAMRERVLERLQQLKAELETGQKMLAELEQRRVNLEQTLLRISGAVQVLEELLAADTVPVNGTESTVSTTKTNA
jgi:predicted nuclease with TOPRIM domain